MSYNQYDTNDERQQLSVWVAITAGAASMLGLFNILAVAGQAFASVL